MAEAPPTKKTKSTRRIIQVLALCAAIAITLSLAWLPIDWRHWDWEQIKVYGYAGLFLITLLSDATVLIPFPGLASVFLAGGFLNPLLVGLICGLGSALGELTGYLAGYGGSAIIEDREKYTKLEGWMRRNGTLTVFVLSLIPNPVFDMAGVAAGALKFPLWRFIVTCWAGKAIKFTAVALAGAASLDFVKPLLGL